jgi:hypothetical protein
MASLRRLLVAAIGALSLVGGTAVSVGAHDGRTLVEFDSMTGVSAAEAAAQLANDRGILPGGAPWVITSGSGQVDREGHLSVQVTGLIIPTQIPPHNPVPAFSATVSCITTHDRVVNLTTGPFATNAAGDATINAKVALPHQCKDAEVFVGLTRITGQFVWFAHSNEEDDD